MLFLSRPAARFRQLATLVALSASSALTVNNNSRMSDRATGHAQTDRLGSGRN